jgi:hypothetical protein
MRDENVPDTAEVFDHFAALTSIMPEPDGALVFYGELDQRGMATAVAASIAGAASLGVDPSADRIKQAVRSGACDFMVNHLDEALRILKNEIRKKQPVAVGLVSDPNSTIAEMTERGVQPDLVLAGCFQADAFVARGAKVLPAAVVTPCSLVVTWCVTQDAATWLPRVDALAIEALRNPLDPSAKWLRFAPRYLQKSLQMERYVRMCPEDLVRFIGLLEERMQSGEIAVPVSVSSDGQPVVHPASSAAV